MANPSEEPKGQNPKNPGKNKLKKCRGHTPLSQLAQLRHEQTRQRSNDISPRTATVQNCMHRTFEKRNQPSPKISRTTALVRFLGYRAFHRAASTQEKMCPSHPSQISHSKPVIKKWTNAARSRPCSN